MKISCDFCARDFEAANFTLTEDGEFCPACMDFYAPPVDRTCVLCNEKNSDVTIPMDLFEVKGYDRPVRVCVQCYDYDSSEDLGQILKHFSND